jgi:hypothetical protein
MRTCATVRIVDHALHDPLPIALPAGFVEVIVQEAWRAHDIEARGHNPAEGSDGVTFGVGRWRRTWNLVARGLDEAGFVVEWSNGVPRARVGSHAFTFYNGGLGRAWEPGSFDFAKSERRYRTAQENELALDFAPDTAGIAAPSAADVVEAVFFMAATTGRGLEAVYLGVPITDRSWQWLRCVWTRPDDRDGGAMQPTTPMPAPTPFSALQADDLVVEVRDESTAKGTGA